MSQRSQKDSTSFYCFHLSSLPCSGGIRSLTPATLRKQGEEDRQGQGLEKLQGLYSLQMLKGSKGLEDLHQFRKNLWAQDRAQPKRQIAESRPWNSHGPAIRPHRRQAHLRPYPLPAPPGETPVLSTSGRFHKTHSRGLLGSQLGAPQPSSPHGEPGLTPAIIHVHPYPTLAWGNGSQMLAWGPTSSPEKDVLHIFHCYFITNRTISWALFICQEHAGFISQIPFNPHNDSEFRSPS